MLKQIIADDKSYKIIVEWKKADPIKWSAIQKVVDNIEDYINESNRLEKPCYSEGVSQPGAVAEKNKKLKEANEFIIEIAKILNMDIDGIGYDGLQFSLDDFQNAIDEIKAAASL